MFLDSAPNDEIIGSEHYFLPPSHPGFAKMVESAFFFFFFKPAGNLAMEGGRGEVRPARGA